MNNDYKTKKNLFGILALISAALFISPVDLMTGIQVDDIGYFITTIVTTILNIKAMQANKVQQNKEYTEV
ncbi:MAG: hypothetical protein MJ111_00990 [Clostridia bacterium]|nr:hypothetical protein [Clostridia bacterium]